MAAPLTNFQSGGEDLSDIYVDQTTITTNGDFLFPESSFSDEGIAAAFNRSLWSWGYRYGGQLGLNDTISSRSSPIQIGSLTDWKFVATAPYSGTGNASAQNAAIKTSGSLWTWGIGGSGRLGLGDVISRSSPVRVGLLTDWKFVGIGGLNGFAIKTNGTLWAWGVGGGTGANGVLGLGDLISTSSPVQVGNGIDWAFVTTAGNRCWAIKTDSTLWAWGYNGTGRLGHNNTISRSSPVQIGTDTDWAIVSGGFDHSLAIRKTGTLWGWGQPARGALGLNNSTPPRSSPVQVGTDTNWKDVSVGPNFTVALRSNGTLWSWGIGNVGQLGLNSTTDITNGVSSPAAVGALTNWKNISAAAGFCTAIKTDGTLWAWGSGNSVGVNSSVNRSSPIQVGSFTDWKSVSSRRASVLARR